MFAGGKAAGARSTKQQLDLDAKTTSGNKSESSINTSSASSSGYLSHNILSGDQNQSYFYQNGQQPKCQHWSQRQPGLARQPPMVPMMIDDDVDGGVDICAASQIDEGHNNMAGDFHRPMLRPVGERRRESFCRQEEEDEAACESQHHFNYLAFQPDQYQPELSHNNDFYPNQTYLIQQPINYQQYHTFSYQPQPDWHHFKPAGSDALAGHPPPEATQINYSFSHLNNNLTTSQLLDRRQKSAVGTAIKMHQAPGGSRLVVENHQPGSKRRPASASGSRSKKQPPNGNGKTATGSQKELAIGCCGKLAKLLLFAANLLFWLAGIALGAWGILSLVDDHKYNLSQLLVFEPGNRMSLFQLLSWSFITLGCATILVGFCGCSALLKNNRWILGLYIFLILAIFALDLATGLLAIIFQERLVANVRLRLANKLRSEYGLQASFTAAIDYIQTRYECCGLEGHFDYDQSLWRLQRLGGFEATVARTCCHLRNTIDDQAHINPRPVNESMCQSTDVRFHQSYRYRRGCLDDLERLVRHKIWNFTIGCAAVGAIILVSLLFATCFCRSIPRAGSSRRSSSGPAEKREQQRQRSYSKPAEARQFVGR